MTIKECNAAKEKKHAFLRRLFGRDKVQPAGGESAELRRQNLSSSYVEHHLTLAEISEVYPNSYIDIENPDNSDGLDTNEAMKRLRDGGRNEIQAPQRVSDLQLFMKQFLHKFWVLLLVAAALSIISYFIHLYRGNEETINLYCAFTLISVVLVMCFLSYRQEKKALQVVSDFSGLLAQNSFVIRDSKERKISAEELVVGDLITIRCGDRIPADARILLSNGLKIENSDITGDINSLDYTHEAAASHINVFDARNIAFKGSYCTEGDGVAVVIRTGQYTMIGNVATFQRNVRANESLLSKELDKFVRLFSAVAIIMGLVFFIIGTIISGSEYLLYNFMTGFIIVIVANIPQGLPATVMSQLAIIAQRMSKKHVYIKNLDVIDELGAATVIATDKTGTLTEDVMILTDLWYNKRHYMVDRHLKSAHLRAIKVSAKKELEKPLPQIMAVMAMCNSASVGTRKFARRVSTKRDLDKLSKERLARPPITKKFTVVDRYGREIVRQPTNSESCASIDGSLYMESAHGDLECGEAGGNHKRNTKFIGPAADVALLRYVENVSCVEGVRQKFHNVLEIPFNSVRRWQLVISHCLAVNQPVDLPPIDPEEPNAADLKTFCVMMKGAPEVILNRCSHVSVDGQIKEIDDEFRKQCQFAWEFFGNEGRLVIAFAHKYFRAGREERFSAQSTNYPQDGLVYLGMCGIMDPPRPETAPAIRQCKEAGVKVFMITGDHPTTASAIAAQIGLFSKKPPQKESANNKQEEKSSMTSAGGGSNNTSSDLETQQQHQQQNQLDTRSEETLVLGETLAHMTKEGWDALLQHKYIVFARTTPEQKLQIVQECQRRGETVAVTGSGVNDAPALAKANIGIAMGMNGSDIAKKTADLILTDDNFASFVKGIEEGRLLFDNLRLSIAYTLAHLWPEVFPIVLNFTLGMPLGLQPLQILSVDLGSELPPAVSLAYEPPERDMMRVPPRRSKTALVSKQLLLYSYVFAGSFITVACFLAYLSVYWSHGISTSRLLFTSEHYFMPEAKNFTTDEGRVLNEADQLYIRGQASAAWQITLVVAQIFHLYMCTTRRVSFLRHGITNLVSVFAVIIEMLLLNLFIYTPRVQDLMGTQAPPTHVWLFGPAIGLYLVVFNEARKFLIRHYPHNRLVSQVFLW